MTIVEWPVKSINQDVKILKWLNESGIDYRIDSGDSLSIMFEHAEDATLFKLRFEL